MTEPDMFADPEGWADHLRNQMRAEFRHMLITASLAAAAEQYGEKFTRAFTECSSLNDAAIAMRINSAANPGRELIKWHTERRILTVVMSDPELMKAIESKLAE